MSRLQDRAGKRDSICDAGKKARKGERSSKQSYPQITPVRLYFGVNEEVVAPMMGLVI